MESLAEQYKDLIQSQSDEQGEESIAEKEQELIQPLGSDLIEDTVKLPVHLVGEQIPDIIDELGL